jgi:hypothetical protein
MSTETSDSKPETEAREPESTATSTDTLSDIEQTEKVSTSTSNEQSGGSDNEAPSPDGQFDGSRSENSGPSDPGPM